MGKKINKTVFVGVSGGVDSSVSAALLKDQGYNVVGVFIRTWSPDFIECTWKDERRDAMRVCAHLDIPFLECVAEEAYKKGVADYMIEEYKNGRTPNPDVMCNREVKFGVFWKFAKENGADFIATGHYAVLAPLLVEEGVGGGDSINDFHRLALSGTPPQTGGEKIQLKKSPDSSKDQVYFLWTLTQEDLSHILFPIGHLKKTEVRKLAEKYKLPTAVKKDSQGVCFLGPLDMKDFLKHYIKEKKGDVLSEDGEVIGSHDGAVFFTLGERHGFTITKNSKENLPYYIIDKNIDKNTITVSNSNIARQDLAIKLHRTVLCNNVNWIGKLPEKNKVYKSQIRYHGEFIDCKINTKDNKKTEVIFDKNILVDKGQSIVFYDKDICLGGAVVS